MRRLAAVAESPIHTHLRQPAWCGVTVERCSGVRKHGCGRRGVEVWAWDSACERGRPWGVA